MGCRIVNELTVCPQEELWTEQFGDLSSLLFSRVRIRQLPGPQVSYLQSETISLGNLLAFTVLPGKAIGTELLIWNDSLAIFP